MNNITGKFDHLLKYMDKPIDQNDSNSSKNEFVSDHQKNKISDFGINTQYVQNYTLLERWEKIPEFLRWLFLFPVMVLIVSLCSLAIHGLSVLRGDGVLPLLLVLPLTMIAYLHLTNLLAPRFKIKLVLLLILGRTLLIPLTAFYIIQDLQNGMAITWKYHWAPFIGEVLTLLASIPTYKSLKINNLKEK